METSESDDPTLGSSSNNINIETTSEVVNSRSSMPKKEDSAELTDNDLKHLYNLVERNDGGPEWRHIMDRTKPNFRHQGWQRDMADGLPELCSQTVYEDATPEQLRDFFWDDEYRLKWDDMMAHASILEECPTTGTMMVHWVRKFPFFCSDREYIIGRRIWESERSYYCITKGVSCDSVPRKDKPRRVDLFYSSWFIQAVESQRNHGEMTACKLVLFHHEDMGIPWEIAKIGVRQGMWGEVKKIEHAFRKYQKAKASGGALSHHACLAQVTTKIDPHYLKRLANDERSTNLE